MSPVRPLSRLVDLLGSSLAMYVSDAGIWSFPGPEPVKLALADLVDAQRSLLERAGQMLVERGEDVPRPAYPLSFTATHDIDLRSLLPRVVAGLRGQVAECDALAAAAAEDAEALSLVREARTVTLSHIDALQSLSAPPQAAAS